MFEDDGSFEVMELTLLRVYSGDKDPDLADADSEGQIIGVSSVQAHPDYRPAPTVERVYDFGVMKTDKGFVMGPSLRLTPLYSTDVTVVKERLEVMGSRCQTMTWDFYEDGERQMSSLAGFWLDVIILEIRQCDQIRYDGTGRMNQTFTMEEDGEDDSLLCGASPQGLPICQMDPGAPIICEGKFLAIVSNIGLLCERGNKHVVISGINNAMAFLTEPSSYGHPSIGSLEALRTNISNYASDPSMKFGCIMFIELIKYFILDL